MKKTIYTVGIVAMALLILTAQAQPVLACSMLYLTPQQLFTEADAVFVGRVTSVKTSTEGEGRTNVIGNVQIDKYWKGNVSKEITITSSGFYTCGPGFDAGSKDKYYLIYAKRDPQTNNHYSVYSQGMKPVTDATAEISALGDAKVLSKEIVPMPPIPVYTFTRDLGIGSMGQDVVELQYYLINRGFLNMPAGLKKGYFGSQTKAAVSRFQISIGMSGTGYVGYLTRIKLNGGIISSNHSPVINGIEAPSSLNYGQVGTWIVKATDPDVGQLSYSVDWGDMDIPKCDPAPGYACITNDLSVPANQRSFVQNATFTHTYYRTGKFTPRFTVINKAGNQAQLSVSVKVGQIETPAVTVLSPNGGEELTYRSVHTIAWKMSNNSDRETKLDIYLDQENYPSFVLDKNVPQNTQYNWIVGTDTADKQIPQGRYSARICIAGTDKCDSSDRAFNLVGQRL